jgi:hypothetical protein
MIIVITHRETDEYGNEVEMISHGIDTATLKNITLPQDDVRYVNYMKFDKEIGEYILKEN